MSNAGRGRHGSGCASVRSGAGRGWVKRQTGALGAGAGLGTRARHAL